MMVAFGALRWSPDVFWKSSYPEFCAAYEGYKKVQGIEDGTQPLTRDELDDLMEKFPDVDSN